MGLFEGGARRRRAAELERRLAELDEWDRRYGLGGAPPGHPAHRPDATWRHHSPDGHRPLRALDPVPVAVGHRPVRRRRGPLLLFLSALLVAGAVVSLPEQTDTVRSWASAAGRAVLGLPGAGQPPPVAAGSDAVAGAGGGADGLLDEAVRGWAPPEVTSFWGWEPPRGRRVLPVVEQQARGAYAFLQTQPDSDVPVGFSPCGSIPVAVNPDGAPAGYTELVRASLARVGAAAGLDVVLVDETDEVWSERPRELGAPVLVSWSDSATVPALAGTSAGMGGATYVEGPDGRRWHATGQVVLDREDLSGAAQHGAVLDHELAHVLGLGHVEDPDELMAAVNTTGRTQFGPGDLAGLAAVGAIPCPGE